MIDIKLRKFREASVESDLYIGEFPEGTTVTDVFTWIISEYKNGTGTITIFGYKRKDPPSVKLNNGVIIGSIPATLNRFKIFDLRVSKSRTTNRIVVSISI